MEDEERNVAQRLRRKHIRTLELLQATTKERDELREKLKYAATERSGGASGEQGTRGPSAHEKLIAQLNERNASLEASRKAYEEEARNLDRRLTQARDQLRREQNRSARALRECERLKRDADSAAPVPSVAADAQGAAVALTEHESLLQAAAKKEKRLEFLVSELKKHLELAQDENLHLVNSALENANRLAKVEAEQRLIAEKCGAADEGDAKGGGKGEGREDEEKEQLQLQMSKTLGEMKELEGLCATRSEAIERLKAEGEELRKAVARSEEALAQATISHAEELHSCKAELAKTRERMLLECARADSCEQKLDALKKEASKAKEGKVEGRSGGGGGGVRFAEHVELKKENARLRAKINDLMSSQKRMLQAGMRANRVRY